MKINCTLSLIIVFLLCSFATSAQGDKQTHTVRAKETLFSIAKQYNITIDELTVANPFLSDGLKTGQTLTIPIKNKAPQPVKPIVENGTKISHIVESRETKFGIAKKYGITVTELERQNPGILQSLPVGYKLMISTGGQVLKSPPVVEKPKPTITELMTVKSSSEPTIQSSKPVIRGGFANYEVKPKETMFSLTQMFDITEQELIKLNPELISGVKIGMILKVPGKGSIIMEPVKPFEDLSKSISSKDKKQLVLLMPFNASRITGDSLKSLTTRLKTESFLNMTLEFYAGALMAIDSAKALGLNIDVRILDSEESKMSSNVNNLVQNFNLKKADVIIGPFYQQYAEKVAELLNSENIPVISPLSKESGKAFSNLYQAMPSQENAKRAMFEFMLSKGGNIIVVNDPKKAANRDFITQNYPQALFAELDANGNINAEKLKLMFDKDKMNYVILDSERTGMILNTTNILLNEMATFKLQLVIIEPNETLDFEEISMKRLTILKLLYPSLTRENNTPEAQQFKEDFRKKNKIYPSQYAIRGFDITFDSMLRLSQEKPFEMSAAENKTEQVESKFDYVKKDSEGFINKGIYILQYEEDLSVKQAN